MGAYGGVVPPAGLSRMVSLEACGPLCDRPRSGRVVTPPNRLERSRWRQTLLVDQFWTGCSAGGVGLGAVTRSAPREEPFASTCVPVAANVASGRR